MHNNEPFNGMMDELAIQTKMENIWLNTCRTWDNCNEITVQAFLSQCLDYNLDPQFCMSWVEQHMDQIPDWTAVSQVSLDWINQHTSSGSALDFGNLN